MKYTPFIFKKTWGALFYWVLVIISVLLLSSCESQRAANKTAWLKRNGYLSADTFYIKDTVRGFDTTIVKQFDTLNHTDTLTVIKDGIKVQTVVKWKDRVIEQTLTKRDTIVVRQQIRKVVTEFENKVPWLYWLILSGMGVVIFGLTFRK